MHYQSIRSFLLSVSLSVLAAACGGSVPAPLAPETILVNGKIVTVDVDFNIVEAVAIRNGKSLAVGSSRQIRALAGQNTEVIDLEGKTVLPGFNDGHGHVTLTWGKKISPIEARFRSAESIEEVLDLLREQMETLGPDEVLWFDRGATSPSQFKENRWPTRFDLDQVSRESAHTPVPGPWRWRHCHREYPIAAGFWNHPQHPAALRNGSFWRNCQRSGDRGAQRGVPGLGGSIVGSA